MISFRNTRIIKEKSEPVGRVGGFDPAGVVELSDKGINIKFIRSRPKELSAIEGETILKVISTVKGTANCMAISRNKIDLPYKN